MPSYNLMKSVDRARLRADRQAELDAVTAGKWPRDTDDLMRWSKGTAEQAKACCQAELDYLDTVDKEVAAGGRPGWEG